MWSGAGYRPRGLSRRPAAGRAPCGRTRSLSWRARCSTRCGTRTRCGRCPPVRPSSSSASTSIHEVTTPQAFQMLRTLELKVRMPERTFGTLDHIIPTLDQSRPYADPLAEEMAVHMHRNMKEFGVPLFDMASGRQGIVHVIGPELGLTQPGHDDRLRGQPHLDPRRRRRHRVRDRDHAGPRRPRDAVPRHGQAEDPPGPRRRVPGAGRLREGRDPLDHPRAGRQGRGRLRVRVRGRRPSSA